MQTLKRCHHPTLRDLEPRADLMIRSNRHLDRADVTALSERGAGWLVLHLLGVLDNRVKLSFEGGQDLARDARAAGYVVEET